MPFLDVPIRRSNTDATAAPTPPREPTTQQQEEPSLLKRATAFSLPVVGALGGGFLGSLVPIPGASLAGAAAGGAYGEMKAQDLLGQPRSWTDVGMNALLPVIPEAKIAGAGSKIAAAGIKMAEGGAIGGGYPIMSSALKGEPVDWRGAGMGAAIGAGLGAPLGAAQYGKVAARAKAADEAVRQVGEAAQAPLGKAAVAAEKVAAARAANDPAALTAARQELAAARQVVRQEAELPPPARTTKAAPRGGVAKGDRPLTPREMNKFRLLRSDQADAQKAVTRMALGGVNPLADLRRWFAPTSLVPAEDVTRLVTPRGKMDMSMNWATRAFRPAYSYFDKMGAEAGIDFMRRAARGEALPKDVKFTDRWTGKETSLYELNDRISEVNNWLWATAQQYRKFKYRENFYPQFWKDKEAADAWFGRRPWEGTKRFTHQRVYQDIVEGMEKGKLVPLSTNPITMQLMYMHDMSKFIAANESFKLLKDAGRLMWVPTGKVRPKGWSYIDDAIARRYFPLETKKGKTVMAPAGQWAADENVARLINNSLSPDLMRSNPTFAGVMKVNGLLNQFQLGFSLWHFTFTAVDAMANEAALAVARAAMAGKAAWKGQYGEAGRNAAQAFKHQLTAIIPGGAWAKYYLEGKAFMNAGKAERLGQGALSPEQKLVEGWLEHGGAKLTPRGQYFLPSGVGSWDNFMTAWREGRVGSAAANAPFAVVDASMRPLFEHAIPRLKVGAFASTMRTEIPRMEQRLGRQLTEGEIAQTAWKAWNSIENRLGELNYDNLFWNNTLKAAMMTSFRAVGFNTGTIREIGGGIFVDGAKAMRDIAARRLPELTPKMQYVIGLTWTAAVTGAMYHRLHTGENPKDIADYFHPKNGDKDESGNDIRVNIPNYISKDLDVVEHPIQKMIHKASPLAIIVFNLLANRDWRGDYVYDPSTTLYPPNDKTLPWVRDVAAFFAKQWVPFAGQQMWKQQGKSPERQVEAFMGIVPTKQGQSPVVDALRAARTGPGIGPMTPAQRAASDEKRAYRQELQTAMGFKRTPEDTLMRLIPKESGKREALREQFPQLSQRPVGSPVEQEFARVGVFTPQAPTTIQMGKKDQKHVYDLPKDFALRLAQAEGAAITKSVSAIIAQPWYQTLTVPQQREILNKRVRKAKQGALATLRPELGRLLKSGALQKHGAPPSAEDDTPEEMPTLP